MEQLVENMDVVINERRDYTTQMRQANKQKQKNGWLSARMEENRLRSEMGDELLPEEEDPVLSQVMENE